MSYFTLKSGEKLYYEDRGEGTETLVMMHGWTSTHEVFSQPVQALQSQARCIIYDHRGHGQSKLANHPGSLFSPALADYYKEHVAAPFRAVCFPNSTHMLVSDYPEKFAEEVGKVLGLFPLGVNDENLLQK